MRNIYQIQKCMLRNISGGPAGRPSAPSVLRMNDTLASGTPPRAHRAYIFKLVKIYLVTILFIISTGGVYAVDFFWEEAAPFTQRAGKFPISAHSDDFSVIAWQEVSANNIYVYLAVKEAGSDWAQRGAVGGPYAFLGTEPSILSLVVDSKGRIIIAAAPGGAQAEILISADRGQSFTKQMVNLGAENTVAPRLFVRSDGGYLLFVTRGRTQSLSIYYSRSDDGVTWQPFEFFTPENTLSLNFLPAHASVGRRDIVFFQSLIMGVESLSTFQLFFKTSDDGGKTWTQAKRFTAFNDPVMQTQASADQFDNQRPHLTRHGENLLLVWERRFSNRSPQIYSSIINSNVNIIGRVERVNSIEAYCNNPIGFIHENNPTVVWFDNRSGNNRVVLAQRGDYDWENHLLSSTSAEASFARPVVSSDGAYIFWQTTSRNAGRIFILAPDFSAPSPRITAVNFTPQRANRSERARVTWNIPADTSGILGFSWSWSQDQNAAPPEQVMIYNIGNTSNLNLEHTASSDGLWYFSVRAQDYAGNWSAPSRVTFNRKNTPPPQVKIHEPEIDANGFLLSNTFNLLWDSSADPYAEGYTWNLQFLGANENAAITAAPSRIMGTNTSVNYSNQDDGIWAFSVSAVDQAGNIGQPSNIIFRTNKFVPYTSVSFVDAQQDEQGILTIRVLGRGFSTGGLIDSIALEREGHPEQHGSFNILSDREIAGLTFENMDEGRYRLRLHHSVRGWYTADSFIPVARTGTVKFGDYSKEWRPSWHIEQRKLITFNPIIALAALLLILCALGLAAMIRGLAGVITESALVKQEAHAIITGDFMPMEKKQKIVQIQKKGRGLRFKLASFTAGLILLVVLMISTPMYIMMINTQQQTLLRSLWDRSSVLLEGLASSARSYLPMALQSAGERGALELMYLPAQSAALDEAQYITITGYGLNSIHTNHIWASNDPNVESKIDTTELHPGVSRFNDALDPFYEEIASELNARAQKEAGELSNTISGMTEEFLSLALRTDAAGERMRSDIQVTINSLELKVNEILTAISGEIGSYPEFPRNRISGTGDGKYILYKPIMYRQRADNNFFRGLIRLEVSTESIEREINYGKMRVLTTIVIVAIAVLLIGITGAFIFATLIIKPIKNLVKHIEMIRDTEDKSKLAGQDIKINTKDEIAILGNTINDMTHGLVKAALAASDLNIGKEIQKKFIPLEMDSSGNKQSNGSKNTPNLDFFGYYEGAKGVSGDYFDYQDLDGRYYAIIKCDVAGKGIPAALIMIQVATMFLNYFKQWKPNAKGMHIEEVVYQINDFIEALGFKGRFAAFTLCLFDSQTGVVRFCNAGDNIIHLYSQAEGKKKTLTLPQTPATGVLPNFMIESTGGYKVQTVTIDKGDILLLYTDGIEEAKRKFRDDKFAEILCAEGPNDTPHENHLCGQADEEMTPERVEAIINAVMARKVYTLRKYHNPEGDVELQFDFSSCEGTGENVIMAMVSVEKMFRCYKPADAGEDSRVLVDKKVDEFLKSHFLQYRRYCSHTREYPENPAYMYYTHIREDEQYDDLTILGIKRK